MYVCTCVMCTCTCTCIICTCKCTCIMCIRIMCRWRYNVYVCTRTFIQHNYIHTATGTTQGRGASTSGDSGALRLQEIVGR